MTPENRGLYCTDLMPRAAESLETAQGTLAIQRPKVAVSHVYHAMFCAASAPLAARDIHRRRHGGVKAAFIQQFCRTGDTEPRPGSMLGKALDIRIDCDYKVRNEQGRSGAEMAVEWSREFLAAVEKRLKAELEESATEDAGDREER